MDIGSNNETVKARDEFSRKLPRMKRTYYIIHSWPMPSVAGQNHTLATRGVGSIARPNMRQ